jgi:UDP:flavonoid glycosyltransferase YjiC (YdhE family)
VCIIWGRSATGMFGLRASALAKAIEAISDLDVEVIVTTTPVELEALGGKLPPRVRVFANAPLRHLLVGADMVLHHGSANCSMTAAVLGVPQLSLAMSGEQIVISERFDTTGVSRTLPGQTVTPEQIGAASRDILGDASYLAAARHLREQMLDRPTPAHVARQLEDLADAGVPARPVAVPAGGLLN